MLIKECTSSFHGEQYGGWRKEKTKNWYDVLIAVRKYNKFRLKAATIWFFNCYMAVPLSALGYSRGYSLTNPMLITALSTTSTS